MGGLKFSFQNMGQTIVLLAGERSTSGRKRMEENERKS
jgi:hypothetical protein